MKIIYEPHPVSPARKAELRAQGCKIIDERFKPIGFVELIEEAPNAIQAEDEAQAEAPPPPALKPRGRPRKGK
jgi:hypothetical protein